ncbi:MAG: type II CAAX endopeptidase family protein [Verrucomicrobiota bacterium]|jgi:membrane protease YdiL (CAAX protease family)
MLSAKPWRGEAVLQFCGAQLLCFCLALTIAGLLQKAGLAAFQPPDGFGVVLLGTLGFQGVAWLLILFFLRQHQVGWCEAFGFRGPQLSRALLMAMLVVIILLPVALGLQQVSAVVLTKLGWPPEEQIAVTLLANTKSWWVRVYLSAFAVVFAPVAEEFIFRGMLYPFVKQRGSPRLAWVGVSFAFALIHNDAATFVPLFVLALALTWLYEKTDNLLAPITAHALFNATNLVALYFLPQINQFLQKFLHVQLLK